MKNMYSSLMPLSLALTLLLAIGQAKAEPADWEIDPEHFSIAFEAGHIGYQQQLGLFLEGGGSFRYDPESQQLSGGRVEIQAASIFTNLDARDNHLRGRDFLNARRNPLILFEVIEFSAADEARGTLTGNLTLLGETHPVELQVTINKQAEYPFGHRLQTLGISAHTTINRSLWGMDYGVEGNLVGDEVTLRFEFEAIRQ
ncbi:MAG: YceI family protein [Pseudohongiellaceae bacterium]